MRVLQSTEDLREYCLRKLGKPVINIEVTTEQADDRIDDALQLFHQRHFGGVEEDYVKLAVTSSVLSKGYFTVPDDVTVVVEVVPVSTIVGGEDILEDLVYQMRAADLVDITQPDLLSYSISRSHLNLITQTFRPIRSFEFNQYTKRLFVREKFKEGDFIIVRAFKAVDPEDFTDIYNDEWIKKYATALIKRQWGQNTLKFDGVQLPGGVTMNGRAIYEDAVQEIQQLEEEFSEVYEMQPIGRFA